MNVTELARQVRVTPNELYELLPKFGFHIGRSAIKVDDRVAQKIIRDWMRMMRNHNETLKMEKAAAARKEQVEKVRAEARTITLPNVIAVKDFAGKIGMPVTDVIRELVKNGILASQNERIDYATANIIAGDFGFNVELEKTTAAEIKEDEASLDRLKNILEGQHKDTLSPRAPVVVVMGHVDHGKTKLLDAIRKTNVVATEAGGITQHIGAYQVVKKKTPLTFIDTPGHEAFTVMRSRGAKVADIAILVVAADDGVQPQTREAAKIIEAAKLPYIVALNKVDKPEADIQKTKSQLSDIGLIPEDWGGKTICVPVAAKTGQGIDELLDMILLVADLEKEKIVANPARDAVGTVIESHIDKGEGSVATVLVQSGTLHRNDFLAVSGAMYGRVRAMKDWQGHTVDSAPPGMPVKILGFKVTPAVGDVLEAPKTAEGLERKARADYMMRDSATASQEVVTAQTESAKDKKLFKIIIRADVLGSLEAIVGALERFRHPEIGVEIVAKGLGSITESEVGTAGATGARIFGFHVPIAQGVERLARDKGVVIQHYKIIYDLLDEVKRELQNLLPPEVIVEEMGVFKVMAIFRTEKSNQIVGGRVEDGKLRAGLKLRMKRGDAYYGAGEIVKVQSGKQEAAEVIAGTECGVQVKTKEKIEIDDVFEAYREEVKQRVLKL